MINLVDDPGRLDLVPITRADTDDFMSKTGVLYKATRASAEKGAAAWPELVGNLRKAVEGELGGPGGKTRG